MKVKLSVFLLLNFIYFSGNSQENQANDSLLRVGIKEAPPFVIKQDGTWQGISINLWEQIAEDKGWQYEYIEQDLQSLIDNTTNGTLDIAVAALSINESRERILDFTHAFYSTGLGIAARAKPSGFLSLIGNLFSFQFFQAVGGLAIILLLFGLLVWIFERKRNPDQFGGKLWDGIGSGFWWSAVTMTTVGYGDKASVTRGGRIVALIWMFMALIVISSFTAAIASSLTVNQLSSVINSPDDLYDAKVATVENSSSTSFLSSRDIGYREVATIDKAMKLLYDEKIDAVVYDMPIMQYLINQEKPDNVKILPQSFKKLYYGFALPETNDLLKEQVDLKILEITAQQEWQQVLQEYLGQDPN